MSIIPMDLRGLEMFLAVVDQGGFNKAAANLNISQSAISRKVDLLEAELGQRLFQRIGNRVVLTRVGEVLARQSHLIFRQIRLMKGAISEIAELRRGEFCIGAGMGPCIHLLPPILKSFHQKFPRIKLRVALVHETEELLRRTEDGQIDLGVATLPVATRDLAVVRFFTEELVVIVGRGHPWKNRKQVEVVELTNFPFIIVGKETRARRILEAFFHSCKIAPHIEMELSNFSAIKPLVEINLGISIVPEGEIAAEVKDNRLHIVRIKGRRLERDLGLVYLRSEETPRILKEMIACFLRMYPPGAERPDAARSVEGLGTRDYSAHRPPRAIQ